MVGEDLSGIAFGKAYAKRGQRPDEEHPAYEADKPKKTPMA